MPTKHELYASDSEINETKIRGWKRKNESIIPKPRYFYFVTPKGLLDNVTIQDHCGLIEYDPEIIRGEKMVIVKKAPQLKKPTKLSIKQIYNLALKI